VLEVGIITTMAMMVMVGFSTSAAPVLSIIGGGIVMGRGGRGEKGGEEARTSVGEVLCEFT